MARCGPTVDWFVKRLRDGGPLECIAEMTINRLDVRVNYRYLHTNHITTSPQNKLTLEISTNANDYPVLQFHRRRCIESELPLNPSTAE
ncbi:AAEL008204-PA [Aedes aegypti]|uniref:AAEL008204-PA n=1 Tax=Aedes aegypti TaxID=7159 RepID=Q16ZG1_AEDAE|nr:AAEL008204-PA [Aedes aegypti]